MFTDRADAGQRLAQQLQHYRDRDDVVILALPRGGVPVAFEVARALRAPLDVLVVRKLGVPGREELAMGAIASGGTRVLNDDVVRHLRVPPEALERVAAHEARELERRERAYRGGHPPLDVQGKTTLLIDDGLATGATMRAAVRVVRQSNAARVVLAVPVASAETCREFRNEVDEVVCADTPADFYAVGQAYRDFSQTSDEEVRTLLNRAALDYSQQATGRRDER